MKRFAYRAALSLALAPVVAGCDRSVVTAATGSGGAGSTAVATNGATSTGHAATSTGVATSTGATMATTGSGGTCAGYLDVAIDNGAPVHWASLCNGSWGSQWTMAADGYVMAGGPPPGIATLNVEGCATGAPGSTGIRLSAQNAMGPGAYGMGTTQYVDPMGITWGFPNDGFKMNVTKVDPVGGYVDGSFSVFVSKGGNAAHNLNGAFHVCRVQDQLVP